MSILCVLVTCVNYSKYNERNKLEYLIGKYTVDRYILCTDKMPACSVQLTLSLLHRGHGYPRFGKARVRVDGQDKTSRVSAPPRKIPHLTRLTITPATHQHQEMERSLAQCASSYPSLDLG
jgi:hypothetical protein